MPLNVVTYYLKKEKTENNGLLMKIGKHYEFGLPMVTANQENEKTYICCNLYLNYGKLYYVLSFCITYNHHISLETSFPTYKEMDAQHFFM